MKLVLLLLVFFLTVNSFSESYLDKDRMSIDNDAAFYENGNFGIGTTDPRSPLHVSGNLFVSGDLRLADTPSSSRLVFDDTTTINWIMTDEVEYLGAPEGSFGILFFDPITDAVIITRSVFMTPQGRLGLGMVDPQDSLGIGGGSYRFSNGSFGINWTADPGVGSGDDARVGLVNSGADVDMVLEVSNDFNDDMLFRQGGVDCLGIASSVVSVRGSIGTLSSDKRLKTNITSLDRSLPIIESLRGVTFYWKDRSPFSRQLGFVAQEVESVFPHLTRVDVDGNLNVRYEEVIPLLTKAIQEREVQIRELERRLEALK